ncbi:MAG: acyl-CoA dehydrogenase [Deltaproteobacteria bacterium]|jgi:alkylation response protein AidB-like acyl-CoA dehydrogenase|nr:acyl-CoA dehydrogenase [Deltaproteobacteria bacterium]
MAQLLSERRDIDFVLYEQLRIEDLVKTEKYKDLNRKMFDMVISEARNLGIKEILPTYAEGDRKGIEFKDGRVTVPQCFHRPYKLFVEGEWIAMAEEPEVGGQGFPWIIRQAAFEYIIGANFAIAGFGNLGHGAAKMIELFGTPKQKELFLEKVYSGQWGGTMLLTEPGAGSDVGALTTTAVKNPDGTYSLSGNKIFITCGEHDLTENIIHPVLARIEGAPPGTKGISLFIVPKIWVNDDGSPGEPNDIVCSGVEEKMGIHASPTCSMVLGGKGQCRGLLLGEENKGLMVMFHMMNEARLDVGTQGFLHASAAYLYAVNYARDRLQGKDIAAGKDPQAPQVPIIRHPDIRRMLLQMKAYVDGMRSFVYYVAYCFDKKRTAKTKKEKERYGDFIELLTPVIKAYCSERGQFVCEQAIQVHGGYGYTKDYPVEQLYRDCKITSIYEGTNGIQAMDLVGRKLGMKEGTVFIDFLNEIKTSIDQAAENPHLADLAGRVDKALNRLSEIALHISKTAFSKDMKLAFAYAHPFMEVVGDVVMAWMLLWRAQVALPRLEKLAGSLEPAAIQSKVAKNKEAAFYDGQMKAAEFYIHAMLPATIGKMNAIALPNPSAIDIHERSFGG